MFVCYYASLFIDEISHISQNCSNSLLYKNEKLFSLHRSYLYILI